MVKRARARWLAVFLVAAAASLAVAATLNAAVDRGSAVAKIGIAAPEKPTDYGWNQQGVESARAAARQHGAAVEVSAGIGYENVEPVLRRLAQRGADLIIAQASGYNTIAPKVAQQFKVPVLVYDNPKAKRKGLVADIETVSQQGAYLAGVLAGQVTKTDTLGIVISAADTNWFKQAGGFVAGARSVNPDAQFRMAQIGQAAYADAAGGKRVTATVIAAGADIVFGMGDGSSFGMMQAVETATPPSGANKVWFIDVIGDKTKIDKKGVLLSSVLWDFTQIFSQAIVDIESGKFGTHNYFLSIRNGISLLRTNKAPAAVWAKVAAARQGIIRGTIKVPLTPTQEAVNALIG
jgi:simple sugar transport system substrate-binding protein